ncbi:MAG: methionyl-tRNA formyltransferase [Pseudohongiellaceae bacterium]
MPKLKIGFAGTPEFAAAHLAKLLNTDFCPIAVFTQPDRRAGRGKKLHASSVKSLALLNEIAVYQPSSLKTEESESLFETLELDLLIVVAYGLILPDNILKIPTFGCINVHASLLPKWRGAAPIERAILAGDSESGVTIMQMDAGLDTGDMLYKVVVSIKTDDSRQDLENNLITAGIQGLIHTLNEFHTLRLTAQKQNGSATSYAAKLDKIEALIDFDQNAEIVNRTIRAGIGRMPAYAFFECERLRLLKATPTQTSIDVTPGTIIEVSHDSFTVACKDSCLVVHSIQLPGKNPVSVLDVLNSTSTLLKVGALFTMAEAP